METQTPPPPPKTATSSDPRNWCVLCHAAALSGIFFHAVGHIFGPLIVWLLKRDDSPEIDAHGRESLNFQLSMLIYTAVAFVLCFLLIVIAIPLLGLLYILNIVFVIIASIKASEGQLYRYPMTIRFLN